MNTTEKIYIFFDDAYPHEIHHPHYTEWTNLLGVKKYYTEADILKMESLVSKTTFKRLLKLREGTSLHLHYLHRNGNLKIRLLTQEEIDILKREEQLKFSITRVNKQIKEKCPELFVLLEELQKDQRNLKKEKLKKRILI